MDEKFVNLTEENIASEHLCCIIRSKKPHPGVEAKRQWLRDRLKEGHIFRKLDVKGRVFIEYAPVEKAWVPICGSNYYYIYCLWVDGEFKGKGYAKSLMEYCISDAKSKGMSGICMLGSDKQKGWLSNQAFAKKYGMTEVDSTAYGYKLLALSFDSTVPSFTDRAKTGRIASQELTVYYDAQCPFILQRLEGMERYCNENAIPHSFVCVDTLEKAKSLPCVFNNWAMFCKGEFVSVNLSSAEQISKLTSI